MLRTFLFTSVPCLILFSCGPVDPPIEVQTKKDLIRVEKSAKLLNSRMNLSSRELPVLSKKDQNYNLTAGSEKVETSFKLTLVGELDSPILDGVKLQATDAKVQNKNLFISYNVRGEIKKGAVDLVDISNPKHPSLVSQLILQNRDVNAISYFNNALYLTGSWHKKISNSYGSRILVNKKGFTTDIEDAPLTGFAGTGIATNSDKIYITTGDNSGLFTLDHTTLARERFTPLYDARDVYYKKEKKELWALTGQTASLVKIKKNGSLQKKYELGGARIPESKSTLEVGKKFILASTGEKGFSVVCKEDGSIISEIAPPAIKTDNELPSVTNAVTSSGSFVFTANGEEGVHIYQMSKRSGKRGCENFQISHLGYIDFGDELSANDIDSKGDFLFVADGLGGLKIILITKVIIIDSETEINDFEENSEV